jgi:hypothetical protein
LPHSSEANLQVSVFRPGRGWFSTSGNGGRKTFHRNSLDLWSMVLQERGRSNAGTRRFSRRVDPPGRFGTR